MITVRLTNAEAVLIAGILGDIGRNQSGIKHDKLYDTLIDSQPSRVRDDLLDLPDWNYKLPRALASLVRRVATDTEAVPNP